MMTPSLREETPRQVLPKPWNAVAQAAAIVLVACLAYLPAFGAGFVFDDHALIRGNLLLRGPVGKLWADTGMSDYWPLTWTGLWLQWRLWGESPAGYHAVNIFLHCLTALLLWRVLAALRIRGAWLAALLFSVHPVTVESVAWVSEQKNTLSATLYLTTLLAWLRLDEARPLRRSAIATLLLSLALLAKTSVVALPVVLLGLAFVQRGSLSRRDIAETAPLFIVAFAAGLVTLWYQTQNAMAGGWAPVRDLGERIGAMGWALATYIETAFVPVRLAVAYPPWPVEQASWLSYAPLAAVLSGFAVLWACRRRSSWSAPVLYALGYHALLLLPVLGLIDIAYFSIAPVGNHLQYLSLMGPAALAGFGIAHVASRRRNFAVAAAVALITVFGIMTFQRAAAFKDDFTLWKAAVQEAPRSVFARDQLSALLLDRGDIAGMLEQLDAAARAAVTPGERHRFRSQWFLYSGRKAEAAAEAREGLRLDSSPDMRYIAATVLAPAGYAAEAIELYRSLVREAPQAAQYSYALAATLSRTGRIPEAADVLREYSRKQPRNIRIEEALALTLIRMGLHDEARQHAAASLGLDAADPRVAERMEAWTRSFSQ